MPKPSSISKILVRVTLGFILLIFLIFIVQVVTAPTSFPGKVHARNDCLMIATAVIGFQAEYGRLPVTGRHVVGGDLLAALMGSNQAVNPRKIVFVEVPPFIKKIGGVSNGVFLDPWGGPYQIAIDPNISVIAGTNNVKLRKIVAVWNDPDQSIPPAWWDWDYPKRDRRYVTSWE